MGFWSGLFSKNTYKVIQSAHQLDMYLRGMMSGSSAGVHVNSDTAMRAATVYACVRVLAESVAQLPLVVYRRTGNESRDRDINHPLYSLLHDQPNEWQTSYEFFETMMAHLALRGNFYAYKNMLSDGRVTELLPIHPDSVMPDQDENYNITYQIIGQDKVTRTLRRDQVFHVHGIGSDGFTGLNPISITRQSIGLALATEEHGARLFSNGARPGGVLIHPGRISEEAAKRLKSSWDAAHGGIENAHKTALLEEGMKWEQLGMTSEDSQFLETRKYQRTEVAAIFRVPPHMIGDLERATFSNIEQQSLEFVKYSLMPWLARIEKAVKRDLFTPSEKKTHFAEFLVEGLLRGDIKSRYDAYATGRQWGWLSANDIRRLENLNPVEDGDIYLQPMNMVPAGSEPDGENDDANAET